LAISYEIDADKGLVITTISGTLSFDECTAHHRKLRDDPAFDPSFNELIDGSDAKRVELFSSAVFSLSNTCPYSASAYRAICAGDKRVHFGIARMFQAFATGKHGSIEVFKSREEALAWLQSHAKPVQMKSTGEEHFEE